MDMFPRSSRSGIPAAKPSRSARVGLRNNPMLDFLNLVVSSVDQRSFVASCNRDSSRTRVARGGLCTGGVWLSAFGKQREEVEV